jgi:hypothetical protein
VDNLCYVDIRSSFTTKCHTKVYIQTASLPHVVESHIDDLLGGIISNTFLKNLPWIAPTVAILAVGSGFLDRTNISFDGADQDVAEALDVEPVDPATAVIAAVGPMANIVPTNTLSDSRVDFDVILEEL